MNKGSIICGVVATVFCCALAGCVVPSPSMKALKSDSLSEKRFQSVVFGRIRFVSKDGYLENLFTDYACTNFMSKDANGVGLGCVEVSLKPWQSSNAYQIEKPFYGEIEPGLYDLRTVSLNDRCGFGYKAKFVAGFAEFNSSFENSKFVYTVPPGGLIYLGTLEVEVLGETFGAYEIKYRTRTINDFQKELQEFKRNYPRLYEQYKGNIAFAFGGPASGPSGK